MCIPSWNKLGKGITDETPLYPSYQADALYIVGIWEPQLDECTHEPTGSVLANMDRLPAAVHDDFFFVELGLQWALPRLPLFKNTTTTKISVFVFFPKVNLERTESKKKSLWTRLHLLLLSHLACHRVWGQILWVGTGLAVNRGRQDYESAQEDTPQIATFLNLAIAFGFVGAQNL